MIDDLSATTGQRVGSSSVHPDAFRRGSGLRVVVVGPCASGKTTLVSGLCSLGYHAVACGQEHSDVPTLWRRSDPDVLIALDADLATIRLRRGAEWSAAIFDRQVERLADAKAAADLVLDVSELSEAAVLARALRAVELATPSLDRPRRIEDGRLALDGRQ